MSGSVGLKLFDLLDQPGNNRCADCGCDGMLISKSHLFFLVSEGDLYKINRHKILLLTKIEP